MPVPHILETVRLQNGARGLLINVPGSPVAAYSINFRSGANKETRAYPFQTAHILEHVVEAGPDTAKYPKKSNFLHEISMNGAWRNAHTGEFGIRYVGDCTPDELIRILRLRLRAIENPKFREDIVNSEIGNVLEENRQNVADHKRMLHTMSRNALSGGDWQTSKEAMSEALTVTLEDIRRYHEATHTTDNLTFTVAGDLPQIQDSIIALFSACQLPRGENLSGPMPIPIVVDTWNYEERSSLENLFTSLVTAIPRAITAREKAVMQIINHLLCNPWDSAILGRARENGLCYGMSGHIELTKTQSIWYLDTPISPNNAGPFFELMNASLHELATSTPATSDIEKAKNLLIGQLRKRGQTSQDLISIYAADFFGRDVVISTEERISLLESVVPEDITALVEEFLSSKSRAFSGVGSITEADFKALRTRLTVFKQ